MSAIVPAPTACTDAAAPPESIRITTSIPMVCDTALSTANKMNNRKETRYTVLRPDASEKADHHNGNIAMLNM
jgi:succinate dehydrogenase/fumarate reductase flavoprotein subunit